MYPRIVCQMAFMGRGALGAVVASSALCKCTSSWLLASSLVIPNRAESPVRNLLSEGGTQATALKLLRRDLLRTDVRTQHLRDNHAPVGLLIIFHNRNPGAAYGQSAAVQRVYKLSLVLAFGTVANVGAPCLIRLEIRARRNLAIQLLSRQPDFNVVCFRRRRSHVARAQRHGAVMQPQLLQNFLGVVREFLVFLVGLLGTRELHQFHFLKLMLPDDATHVFSIRSRFAAEARRVGGERDRQPRLVEHFVTIKVRDRNFRRRN